MNHAIDRISIYQSILQQNSSERRNTDSRNMEKQSKLETQLGKALGNKTGNEFHNIFYFHSIITLRFIQ